ncbi:hypothetical protein ACFYV7_15040 [Nocardia suismassiliense]|uniref:Uncharacterized protein n=1 Tax=Nocardia suismassiliense TaxID=2077092 RepID=A0ABW6QSA9_9NOCA
MNCLRRIWQLENVFLTRIGFALVCVAVVWLIEQVHQLRAQQAPSHYPSNGVLYSPNVDQESQTRSAREDHEK